MIPPSPTRLMLLFVTIFAIVILAPWLAAREDPVAPGLISQICTSLGIIEAPSPAPPAAHTHH